MKNYLADAHAQALANLVKSIGAEYVMATATARGKDLMPRLAARMDAPMASDIITINDDGTRYPADVRRQRHGDRRDGRTGQGDHGALDRV